MLMLAEMYLMILGQESNLDCLHQKCWLKTNPFFLRIFCLTSFNFPGWLFEKFLRQYTIVTFDKTETTEMGVREGRVPKQS